MLRMPFGQEVVLLRELQDVCLRNKTRHRFLQRMRRVSLRRPETVSISDASSNRALGQSGANQIRRL